MSNVLEIYLPLQGLSQFDSFFKQLCHHKPGKRLHYKFKVSLGQYTILRYSLHLKVLITPRGIFELFNDLGC